MRRVVVVGSGGAGKTTLAARIAGRTGLPLVHLDAHYWRGGWTPTPSAEWRDVVARFVAADSWVIDGNYGATLDVRLAACDTVVFLDVPRRRCLWRVIRRRLRYRGRARPEMPAGCEERLTWEFVRWIWTYPAQRRPAMLQRLRALPPTTRVEIVRTTEEAEAFLAALAPPPLPAHVLAGR